MRPAGRRVPRGTAPFALVLAVAAAQDLQVFGAVVQAAIVSVSVVVGVVVTLLAFRWKFARNAEFGRRTCGWGLGPRRRGLRQAPGASQPRRGS